MAKKSDAAAGGEARVLVDCHLGRVNDIIELDAGALADAKGAGLVDDDHGAVAFARTLAQG